MDYAIGSLSDLITGKVTPNKRKVVKKQIESQNIEENIPSENANGSARRKKIKRLPQHTTDESQGLDSLVENSNTSGLEEDEPVKKKSKNAKNAEKRLSSKNKPKKQEEDPELRSRTVFVGNLPISVTPKKFKKLFTKYGQVESVRIRGVPVADPKTPKKVAIIKKEFHPDRKSFHGYVRFQEREGAVKATAIDGILYQDHHLRVHLCDVTDKPAEDKAIFVGNLSFYAEEDDLWKTFESCGPILSVRIVRDPRTGMGKGFGYVNFQNSDSVTLALEMENVKLKDRELRVKICNINGAKKNSKKNKGKKINPRKRNQQKATKSEATTQIANTQEEKPQIIQTENASFQGVKFAAKKKNKLNKGLLEKRKKIKQIAPK
ncbi:RNA-binding protein 34-like [Zophobas morio]|uniref:RNA-binding protein 34-like n=1 Tax=Zophobas morio TaxID=2755281 RepID=UPI003083074F